MNGNAVVVYADKTVIRVQGLNICGLNTRELERLLTERFKSIVRVIGVTGSSIDMDVYGMDPEKILRDEQGLIRIISTAEGITPREIAKLVTAERILAVDYDQIPERQADYCARERWMQYD